MHSIHTSNVVFTVRLLLLNCFWFCRCLSSTPVLVQYCIRLYGIDNRMTVLLLRDHRTGCISQENEQFTTQPASSSEDWLKVRLTPSSSAWVTRKGKDLVKKWKQLHQKQVIQIFSLSLRNSKKKLSV